MERSAAGPRRGLRLVGRTFALCVWFYVGLPLLIAVPAALAGVFIVPVSIGVVAFAVVWVVMPLRYARSVVRRRRSKTTPRLAEMRAPTDVEG